MSGSLRGGLALAVGFFAHPPQGELRWQRTIADLRSRIKSSYFYDVAAEDTDGMLVFTGLYQGAFPNHTPAINNPNVWLVKLDSMGCLEPGCDEVLLPGMYLAQVQTAAGQTGVVEVVLK